jgi:prophage antirepressor-like protein
MKNRALIKQNTATQTAAVQTFTFLGFPVRGLFLEGKPWFTARDIANVLEYKDTVNAIKLHCRGVVKYHPIVDALGRTQNARLISEPDVYRLISNSKTPKAMEIEAWIYEEVLPQIRKTGAYIPKGMTLVNEAVLKSIIEEVVAYHKPQSAITADLAAVNAFIKESVPRIKFLTSENDRLRQMNRLYEEMRRLREQLARKNTPLAESEKRQILACAKQWSVAEIARFTNRSETAIRWVIKGGTM